MNRRLLPLLLLAGLVATPAVAADPEALAQAKKTAWPVMPLTTRWSARPIKMLRLDTKVAKTHWPIWRAGYVMAARAIGARCRCRQTR